MVFRNIQVLLTGNETSLRRALVTGARDVERFSKQVKSSSSSASSSAGLMRAGVAVAAVAVGAALAISVKSAAEFEKRMRNVNSISGLSERALAALSKQTLNLSKTLPQSANELAEGLYDIASSGFQGADGLKVLTAAAQAASAGLSDTATSGKAITAVLNAYGRGAQDASDVSDVLFQTVNLGVVTFGELAGQIGDVVGTAAAAKVGIEQVGAAVATMTLSGISAAESTTSLNRLLQSLLQPSDALASVFQRLGYESGSAALQSKGLHGVMADIQQVTGGNIDVMLALFPEIRAARGAFALLADSGQTYADVAARIEDKHKRAGATMRALREQMKSVSAQWQLLQNRGKVVAITAGTHLLPTLLRLMHGSEDLAGSLSGPLAAGFRRALPFFRSLGDIGGDVVTVVHTLTEVVGPLGKALGTVAVVALIAFLNTLGALLRGVTGFFADHKVAVVAAATAIALLTISVSGLQFAFNRMVVTPIVMGLFHLAGAAGGAAEAVAGLSLATAATTAGVTLVVAALAAAYFGMKKSDQKAKELAGTFDKMWDVRSATKQAAALAAVHDELAKNKRALDGMGKSTGANVRGWKNLIQLTTPMKNSVSDTSAAVRALTTEENKLANRQVRLDRVMRLLAAQGLTLTAKQVSALADKAGIDLVAAFDKTNTNVDDLVPTLADAAQAMRKSTTSGDKLKAGVASLSDVTQTAEDRVKGLKTALDALIGVHLNAAEAAIKFEKSIDDISASVTENGRSLDITTEKGRNNTQAVLDSVSAISDHINAMAEEGKSSDAIKAQFEKETTALKDRLRHLGFTEQQIGTLTTKMGLIPKNVETLIKTTGLRDAQTGVSALKAALANLPHDVKVKVNLDGTLTVDGRKVRTPGAAKQIWDRLGMEYGGVFPYASGGTRLPRSALVQREKPDLVQWAEPGTGGEAFIPLAPDRRGRSTEVLADVASRFGYSLLRMADGGLTSTRPTYVDPGQVLADLLARLEDAARRVAEDKAAAYNKRHKGADKSGTDFYIQPHVSARQFQAEMARVVAVQRQWRKDLAAVSRRAGADVADALEAMGRDGVALVHQFATASAGELKGLTQSLSELAPVSRSALAAYADELHSTTRVQSQFQKDLLTLIKHGHAALAAQLFGEGEEAAAGVAHQAARAKGGELRGIESDLAKSAGLSSGNLGDMFRLVGVLVGGRGIGVRGLAALSGMDLPQVLALLEQYKRIFAQLPKSKIKGVQADLAAISRGRQPKAYESGGFAPAGAGLYRFAERGSGGEWVIPAAARYRNNALSLWADAGDRLGVQAAATSRGPSLVIQAGAMPIQITGVAGADAAQVARHAERAIERQFNRLAVHLTMKTGTRG